MYGIRLLSEFLTKNQNNNNILGELIEFLLNKNVLKEILDFLSKTIKQSNLNEVYSLLSQMSYYLLFIIKEETLNAIINLFILHIKTFITHFIQDVSKTSLITFLLHLSFQNPRFKAVLFSSDDFMSRALQEVKEIKLNINTYNYFLQLLKLLSILAKKEKEITLDKIIALYDAFDSVTKKSPGNESIISVCLYTFSHLLFYKVQMINDKIFELIIKAIRDQPLLESKNEDLIIPLLKIIKQFFKQENFGQIEKLVGLGIFSYFNEIWNSSVHFRNEIFAIIQIYVNSGTTSDILFLLSQKEIFSNAVNVNLSLVNQPEEKIIGLLQLVSSLVRYEKSEVSFLVLKEIDDLVEVLSLVIAKHMDKKTYVNPVYYAFEILYHLIKSSKELEKIFQSTNLPELIEEYLDRSQNEETFKLGSIIIQLLGS